MKIKVHQAVIARLENCKKKSCGDLYGLIEKDTLIVLALTEGFLNERKSQSIELINFPTELELCGTFDLGSNNYEETKGACVQKRLMEVEITDTPVALIRKPDAECIESSLYINNQLQATEMEVVDSDYINSGFLHLRVRAEISLECEADSDSLKEAFLSLKKKIASGAYIFHFEKQNMYCVNSTPLTGPAVNDGTTVDGLLGQQEIGEQRPKHKIENARDILEVAMLKRLSMACGLIVEQKHAPIMYFDKKTFKQLRWILYIDAISMVSRKTTHSKLYFTLVESVIKNVKLYQRGISAFFDSVSGNADSLTNYAPRVFHYFPEDCGHFVSRFSNVNCPDSEDEKLRLELHSALLLPSTPLFRRANRYVFEEANVKGAPLTNPHLSIKTGNNDVGAVSLVRGKYLYYHYCQQGENDDGWGCAYRSLQTVASWFRLQGHTDRPAEPGLKHIQECLFNIGDKPASFVGSREWIGSTEVGFVLDTLLGVQSRIVRVATGREMSDQGPELEHHFRTNGTPVMIGGNRLAHTILGVEYCANTGAIKFLILDPHYTGADDLQTIIGKKWCAWKGVEFWNTTTYYNMCLPQVPRKV